jgi:phage-related protein
MSSPDLDIFTWLPQYGAEASVTPSVLTSQYGDGYAQDVPIGINSTPQVWTLSFNNDPATADQIFQFLQNQGGVKRFWWTPPRQNDALKCKTVGAYKKQESDAGQVTISVTFQQVFDPD